MISSVYSNPQTELLKLTNSYNPKSENFQFNAILYNKVLNKSNAKQYQKPSSININLWQQAQKQNPYPEYLIPIIIKGYEQLKNRTIILSQAIKQCKLKQKELREIIEVLKSKQIYEIKKLIEDLKKEQTTIGLKLFKVLRQISIKYNYNKQLTNHELVLGQRIEEIKYSIISRNNFISNVKELISEPHGISNQYENTPLKRINIYEITLILKKQQYLIRQLNETLLKDIQNFKIIIDNISQVNYSHCCVNN